MLLVIWTISLCTSGAFSAHQGNGNLLDELAYDGNFTKILDLIGTSLPGLLGNVSAMDDVTLFLPTDEAMSRVPDSVINDLKSDTQKLRDLILYHIIANDTIRIRKGSNDKEFMSMAGIPVRVNTYKTPDIHAAEGINITKENIPFNNGFVQGIDGLMTPPTGDIVSILSSRPDMKIFSSLINQAGLVEVINKDRNITVFAPTDASFSQLPATVIPYLESHISLLKDFVLYHFIDKTTMYSIGMRNGIVFQSSDSNHDKLMLLEDHSGHIYLNRAQVTEKDISATNGVLHVINDVLIPTEVLLDLEVAGLNALVG